MGLVPKKQLEKVAFFKEKATPWSANATAIGTTAGAVSAMSALVTAAESALATKGVALTAAKSAIDNVDLAIDALAKSGADIISSIRTKARTGGDGVYTLAGLPVPTTPTNRPAPGVCFDFKAVIGGAGAVETSWKCNNPTGTSGTIYQIYRSSNGTTDFQLVGGSGQRKFTDDSIPAGVTYVTYKIQAMRSTVKGGWATFNVFFGSNAGGGIVTVLRTEPVKLAA